MSASDFLGNGVIGLTGGMGSGKSTVATFMCEVSGAKHIDADHVCRQLLEPHEKGWCAIKNIFGGEYFRPDQTIDRPRLRHEIFHDKEVRNQLNLLLHPLVRDEIAGVIQNMTDSHAVNKLIVEVPLLFEAHWQQDFGATIVVYADNAHCLKRLMKRDQLSRSEAEVAIAAQWPLPEKVLLADHVINNNGTWLATCLQILHLARLLWNGEARLIKKSKR